MAMRLNSPTNGFQQSVKLFYRANIYSPFAPRSLVASSCIARRYYASSGTPPQSIAILGSGITGLTTAYYLSKAPNPPHVTIYEAAPRVGGWVNSKYVDVRGGKVLFEQGPRSLRPAMPRGFHAAALIEEIGLADEIIFVPKDSPAARDRWLYYPDHLVHVPHPSQGIIKIARTLFTEEAFEGVLWDAATELIKDGRTEPIEDESVGAFFSRRVNHRLVDQIISGVLHGIYAGDAYQLSAKSLMPEMWYGEKEHTSIVQGLTAFKEKELVKEEDFDLVVYLAERAMALNPNKQSDLDWKLKNASVFTLKRGLASMTERMESLLKMSANVTFKMGTPVRSLKYDHATQKIKVKSSTSPPKTYDQVISTIYSKTLSTLTLSLKNEPLLPSLSKTPAVTVSVVNLYYPDPSLLPIQGFGYLIPQATPLAQNPELALGVVFDCEITTEQDTAPGTKLTVMLGGHWWDGWDTLPSNEKCIEMAKSVLKRHLGIHVEPEATLVNTQRDCIPQYTVGHSQRLKEAHLALLRSFRGKLKVAGNSYTGVGVNDCLMAAQEIAGAALAEDWKGRTGLDRFERDVKFVSMEDLPRRRTGQ